MRGVRVLIVSACLFVIALSINVSKMEGFQASQIAALNGIPYTNVKSTDGVNIILDGGDIYNTKTGSLSSVPKSPILCPSDQVALPREGAIHFLKAIGVSNPTEAQISSLISDMKDPQIIRIPISFKVDISSGCTYTPSGPYTGTATYNAFTGTLVLPGFNYPTISCPGYATALNPPIDPILFNPQLTCSTPTSTTTPTTTTLLASATPTTTTTTPVTTYSAVPIIKTESSTTPWYENPSGIKGLNTGQAIGVGVGILAVLIILVRLLLSL